MMLCMHVCMCIQIEKIKLPSEMNDNPINGILFYKKPKSGNDIQLLTKKEVQEMVYNIIMVKLNNYYSYHILYTMCRHHY